MAEAQALDRVHRMGQQRHVDDDPVYCQQLDRNGMYLTLHMRNIADGTSMSKGFSSKS